MHSEPLRTAHGGIGWFCQRERLQMTLFRASRLLGLMGKRSRLREELQHEVDTAGAGVALRMPHWTSVRSFAIAPMRCRTKRCTVPLQRACSQVAKSS